VIEAVVDPTTASNDRTVTTPASPRTSNSSFRTGRDTPGTVPLNCFPTTLHVTLGSMGGRMEKAAVASIEPPVQVGVLGMSPFMRSAGARTKKVPSMAPPGAVDPLASAVNVSPPPKPSARARNVRSALVVHEALACSNSNELN
jgi:hypothetical protein